MPQTMEGKVALVTGASSGIGRAAAVAFGAAGASVVAAARRKTESDETIRMIRDTGGEALFVQTDVSRADQVQAMVAKTVETYGRLDYAFNNAGVSGPTGFKRLHEYDEEEWDFVNGINEKGVWLCMKYELEQMLTQGGGVIVNDSSIAGMRGGPTALYSAAKHGVLGLTRTAAKEYGQDGIRVNAVCPGVIDTDMLAWAIAHSDEVAEPFWNLGHLGRWGRAGEIASVVLFLCSEEASFVTGIAMPVDAGIMA